MPFLAIFFWKICVKYREERLAEVGLKGVFPLWLQDTAVLAQKFVTDGFNAYTVCVNGKQLTQNHVGQKMDAQFFASLPDDVDLCGENGEFHSFVFDGPIFQYPIPCQLGEIVHRQLGDKNDTFDTSFWYADLHPTR